MYIVSFYPYSNFERDDTLITPILQTTTLRLLGRLFGLLLFSLSIVSDPLRSHGLQQVRLPCPSLSPGVCLNSCPLNRWCHPTISSSVAPFSSCPQSFPASGSFPVSRSGRVDSLELSIVFSGEVTWNPPYWEKEVRFALRALEDSI